MEKQGVTFSEQSWRDFLDFLRDVKPPVKDAEDTDTNSFVDAYYKQQKSKSKPKVKEADEISKAIYDIMQGRLEPGDRIQSVDIRNELHRAYGIQVQAKAFSSKMIKAMYAYPVIIKTARGEFALSTDLLLQEVSDND